MTEPAVIDSLEFARSGQRMQGTVAVAQLPRLADSLFDTAGELRFALAGVTDARQRPRLELKVEGEINLKCQRCLGPVAYPLAVASSLLVLGDSAGGETAKIGDLDAVPAGQGVDVQALVEDEVLLAIPISPRHDEGQCSLAVAAPKEHGASPFAVLAEWKHGRLRN